MLKTVFLMFFLIWKIREIISSRYFVDRPWIRDSVIELYVWIRLNENDDIFCIEYELNVICWTTIGHDNDQEITKFNCAYCNFYRVGMFLKLMFFVTGNQLILEVRLSVCPHTNHDNFGNAWLDITKYGNG